MNGSVKAPFIVDTGATLCTIQAWAVKKLGITIDASTPKKWIVGVSGDPMEVPIVTVREVRIGTAVVKNVDGEVQRLFR